MDDRGARAHEAAAFALDAARGLRGLAGKLAQAAELVPGELRPRDLRFGARASAPMPWSEVRGVLEAAWDEEVRGILESIEHEPRALASTGQVHRAVRASDGRAVAVKVQRPGAEEAVRADLQNLGVLARLAGGLVPGLDVAGLVREARERTLEELDHEFEAQSARAFARAYRGHPFVVVPAPDTELSHPRVLVADWIDGRDLDAVQRLGDGERDRVGEMLVRFHLGAPYRMGRLHGDPHPGNWRLLDDGRLAVIDFGAATVVPADRLQLTAALFDAGARRDAPAAHAALAALGYLRDPAAVDPQRLLALALGVAGWAVEDRAVRIDPPLLAASGRALERLAPGCEDLLGLVTLPPEDLVPRRLEAGLAGVLAQLAPTANWRRIGAEWWAAAEPETELGRQEAAFWAGRRRRGVSGLPEPARRRGGLE